MKKPYEKYEKKSEKKKVKNMKRFVSPSFQFSAKN